MNTQHYTDNGHHKFPVTTETFEFIQEQIKLVYGLASLGGQNIIISDQTGDTPGLCVVGGELMPLMGVANTHIEVIVENETVSIAAEDFEDIVRTKRYAVYVAGAASGRYAVSQFTRVKDIATLQQHQLPKGSVIDWYGECLCANIPYGYVPCGKFDKGMGQIQIVSEKTAWNNRYGNIIWDSQSMVPALKMSSCNGVAIPDLTDRFVVTAGHNYDAGDTGGSDTVTLTPNQTATKSGMVTNVTANTANKGINTAGTAPVVTSVTKTTSSNANAAAGHENRPPYFALYKLIKVI